MISLSPRRFLVRGSVKNKGQRRRVGVKLSVMGAASVTARAFLQASVSLQEMMNFS